MLHIRFFYSDKEALELLKNKILKDGDNDIYTTRSIIQLNFCLDYPLESLKNDTYDYFFQLCNEFEKAREFSSLEYFDLLDSLFFLIASNYNFKVKDEKILSFLEMLIYKIKINNNDELSNYSKIYLLILVNYLLYDKFDKNIIIEHRNVLENLFEQFKGLIDDDYQLLYNVITTDLININRMKLQYTNSDNFKTVGYQNFSNMYATIGKMKFWEMIGIKLDYSIINEKFENELGKDFKYFNF